MKTTGLVALVCALAVTATPFARKKKEEITETLQLPRELPAAVTGETRRLAFYTTPLSSHGLLSQQIRDGLKALSNLSGGAPVLRLRAFVAGTGDMRRVRDIVSETYTSRKLPLPALSLIQAGGLPMEGAQVVLEAIVSTRKEVNPGGIAFISAQTATSPDPSGPVPPLTEKALAQLRTAIQAAGVTPAAALRVTCFFSSLEGLASSRKLVEAEYGRAALNFVQAQRAPGQALAACEAVVRLTEPPAAPQVLLSPAGLPQVPGESQIALVGAPRLIFTGTQISYGFQESDARLAFDRLRKAIEQSGASPARAVFASYYPLSGRIAAQVRTARQGVFDPAHPPASSLLTFESLPGMDAGFAVDVVAARE